MGRVAELEKKLKGEDDQTFSLILFISILIFSLATPWVAFDLNNTSDLFYILVAIVGAFLMIYGIISAVMALYAIQADPQEFVDAYKWDYPQKEEIEILELAYKKAHKYQNEAFKNALTAWLGLGFYLGLLEIGLAAGDIAVKNWSYLWAVIGICSIASFVGFIITIISYLRKRSIEKALFAIQLKKSDKAELSIKL